MSVNSYNSVDYIGRRHCICGKVGETFFCSVLTKNEKENIIMLCIFA